MSKMNQKIDNLVEEMISKMRTVLYDAMYHAYLEGQQDKEGADFSNEVFKDGKIEV